MLSSKKKKQSHFRSVISDIFDGSILSLVQCLTCDRVRCTAHILTLEGATYQHTKQSIYAFNLRDARLFFLHYTVIFIFTMKQTKKFWTAFESSPLLTKTLLNLRPKFWMCHRSLQQWKHFKICPSQFPGKKTWRNSTLLYIRIFLSKRAPVLIPTSHRDGSPTLWTPYAGQSAMFSERW